MSFWLIPKLQLNGWRIKIKIFQPTRLCKLIITISHPVIIKFKKTEYFANLKYIYLGIPFLYWKNNVYFANLEYIQLSISLLFMKQWTWFYSDSFKSTMETPYL